MKWGGRRSTINEDQGRFLNKVSLGNGGHVCSSAYFRRTNVEDNKSTLMVEQMHGMCCYEATPDAPLA
ncbi:hypothetical protein M0804_003828 [Polistes exclamans]|nr:hypothetical protein M0804_003828 [Polistes exclamans]